MTLLGTGGFSLGQRGGGSTMDMSLDEMIRSRRKRDTTDKNADVTIARNRARRQATQDARRGLAASAKPTPMQVEKEVKKQEFKTAVEKSKKLKQAVQAGATAKLPPKLKQELRKSQREVNKIIKDAAVVTKGKKAVAAMPAGRAPSKKAVNAAVEAMEDAGYKVPEGMAMVITMAPIGEVNLTDKTSQTNFDRQNDRGGGRGNRGGRWDHEDQGGGRGNRGGRRDEGGGRGNRGGRRDHEDQGGGRGTRGGRRGRRNSGGRDREDDQDDNGGGRRRQGGRGDRNRDSPRGRGRGRGGRYRN